MHFFKYVLVFFASIYSKQLTAYAVCVIAPLLTSPLRFPRCLDEDGAFTNNRKLNWTTCFVQPLPCNASYKYRTIDGSCNNLDYPTIGMVDTVFTRLLPSAYQDHRHSLAMGVTGQRPLARVLRTAFFPDRNHSDAVTLVVMQWGQVVAHDTAISPPSNSNPVNCCNNPPPPDYEDMCLPIKIPSNDYFYSQYNVTCISEIRSNVTVIGDCNKNQPAQQINGLTHSIDASLVYGSSLNTSAAIREFAGGRLKTQILKDGRAFLPNVPIGEIEDDCFVKSLREPCYVAGDVRVNQNTELTTLQVVLLREHNRLAGKLQELHPEWNDEIVFQESRNILIAQFQHITYGEWLVYYIGEENMQKYYLFPKQRGYTKYNRTINLATINSFATAAYRIGHSGIQGYLRKLNYQLGFQGIIPISKWMNRPLVVEQNNNYDELLLGLTNQPMQIFDRYYTEQMTNLLFRGFAPYGQDLLSLDIERGRDHGLAPYVHYLEICTGYKVTKFEDLGQVISVELVYKLKKYYKSVLDIDLIVGGILENIVPNTRLGPTFLCIVTEQFYRKKWGDRFWYEVGGQPHSFTERQLQEIRKASLSRLLCDSGDRITQVAINSFLSASDSNKITPCSDIPAINLTAWQ